MSRKNIIISPSGKLYGSEYVLLDFVKGSTKTYDIYAPKNSIFYNKLKEEGYNVYGFSNIKILYVIVFFKMLIGAKNLYLNEAGHISYVKLLAKLLPKRKFVVVIRLLEDCNDKLNTLGDNIKLVAVSNFIKKNITSNTNSVVVYDPYQLKNTIFKKKDRPLIQIGVVGRITETKGLGVIPKILNDLPFGNRQSIKLNFYGSYDEDNNWFKSFKNELNQVEGLKFSFAGFVKDQNALYEHCDLILHVNKVEALGRIIFEAVDYDIPFLCFNQGGSGELAHELGLLSQTATDEEDMTSKLKEQIINRSYKDVHYVKAKAIIQQNFKHTLYASKIEMFL